MKIIRAKHYWFCFWVKRAYEIVEKNIDKYWKADVWWELIHNTPALELLRSKWMRTITWLDEIKDNIIIRSHWISQKKLSLIKSKSEKVINAVCPYVTNVHINAQKYQSAWRKVILIWDWNHPEMLWVMEDLNDALSVKTLEEAEKLQQFSKIWVVSQKTIKKETFDNILEIVKTKTKDLKYTNTICNATTERQDAIVDLAKKCDLVLVIWWKKSSNTKKLEELAFVYCQTKKIEYSNEIEADWFNWVKTLWISAWASTPDWLINNVEKEVLKIK